MLSVLRILKSRNVVLTHSCSFGERGLGNSLRISRSSNLKGNSLRKILRQHRRSRMASPL